jgi:hypothetical protein
MSGISHACNGCEQNRRSDSKPGMTRYRRFIDPHHLRQLQSGTGGSKRGYGCP